MCDLAKLLEPSTGAGVGDTQSCLLLVCSLTLGAPPFLSVSSVVVSAEPLLLLSLEIFPGKYLPLRDCFEAGPDITAEQNICSVP